MEHTNNVKIQIPERFSQALIDQYKKDHGHIYLYQSKDGKHCIIKSPTLQILDACRTISGGSSIKFDEALLNNCWVDGDIELKTVDEYKMGVFDWLGQIIRKVSGRLEEL